MLKLCIFLPCNAKTLMTDTSLPAAKQHIDALEAFKLAKAAGVDGPQLIAVVVDSRGSVAPPCAWPRRDPAFNLEAVDDVRVILWDGPMAFYGLDQRFHL